MNINKININQSEQTYNIASDDGYLYAGIATPTTNPDIPDVPVFYLATEAGTYSNFGDITIADGEAAIIEWNGSWVKKTSGFAAQQQFSEIEKALPRSLTAICFGRNFVPNIDSNNFTLDLGNEAILIVGNKSYALNDSARAVPIIDRTIGSSAQMVIYNTTDNVFYNKIWTYKLTLDEVLILMIRFTKNGTEEDVNIKYVNAEFAFTIDGVYPYQNIDKYEAPFTFITGNDASPYPNIDTEQRILDLGVDPIFRLHDKIIILKNKFPDNAEKYRNISFGNNTLSSALILILNVDTAELYFKEFGVTAHLNSKELIIGSIRLDNINGNFVSAVFPFTFTIDGKYIVDNGGTNILAPVNITKDDIFSYMSLNGNRFFVSFPSVIGSVYKVAISKNSDYQIALQQNTSSTIKDTGWVYNFDITVDNLDLNKIKFQIRKKDDSELFEEDKEKIQELITLLEFNTFIEEEYNHRDLLITREVANKLNKHFYYFLPTTITDINEIDYIVFHGSSGDRHKYENIPVFFKANIKIDISDANYQIALQQYDELNNRLHDTIWVNGSINTTIDDIRINHVSIWIRKADNGSINSFEEQDIINSLTVNIDSIKEIKTSTKVAIPSEELIFSLIDKNTAKNIYHPIISIAHQGISTTEQRFGNSRLSSIRGAYLKGFDATEVDIKFSSDGIPVCCHDYSFTDKDTQETVVIAEHTYDELKTYNYYGETIASFDEVALLCKQLGLYLCIDHIGGVNNTVQQDSLIQIVRKYQMQDRVYWFTGNSQFTTNILKFYNKSKICFVTSQLTQSIIDSMTLLITDYNEMIIDFNYVNTSVDELIEFTKTADPRLKFWVWTIDDLTIYNNYKPYVSAITSNKLGEFNIVE